MGVADDLGGVSPGDRENIADALSAKGVLIRLHQFVTNKRQHAVDSISTDGTGDLAIVGRHRP
jgi:hypothetical protein